MTPTEIKSVLAKMGGHANKRLGQHFLISPAVLDEIVNAADIKPGDLVLEVGPGLGVLTRALADRGAEVVAIEQDRRFVEWLRGDGNPLCPPYQGDRPDSCSPLIRGAGGVSGGFTVIHGDAAIIHWHELIGDRPWKFVSNLPYSLTSLALRKALWAPKPPEIVVVLVQREVAERAVANFKIQNPKSKIKTSLLSLMVALASDRAEIIRRVPAGAFYPPPKVESAVLRIVPLPWLERENKWGLHPDKIMELAKRGFAHPRKFLVSNLGWSATSLPAYWPASLSPKVRAEDLSPQNWAKLALAVQEAAS